RRYPALHQAFLRRLPAAPGVFRLPREVPLLRPLGAGAPAERGAGLQRGAGLSLLELRACRAARDAGGGGLGGYGSVELCADREPLPAYLRADPARSEALRVPGRPRRAAPHGHRSLLDRGGRRGHTGRRGAGPLRAVLLDATCTPAGGGALLVR